MAIGRSALLTDRGSRRKLLVQRLLMLVDNRRFDRRESSDERIDAEIRKLSVTELNATVQRYILSNEFTVVRAKGARNH